MNEAQQIQFIIAGLSLIAGCAIDLYCGERHGITLGWAKRGMYEMRRNSILAEMRRDNRTGRFRKWPMPQRTFGDHLESSIHTKDL